MFPLPVQHPEDLRTVRAQARLRAGKCASLLDNRMGSPRPRRVQKERRPGAGSGFKLGMVVALLAVAVGGGWLALRAPGSPSALCDALARRRIVTVYIGREARVRCEGVREEPLPVALVRGLDHPTPGPV